MTDETASVSRLRGVLLEIASGHPDPAGHARRSLRANRPMTDETASHDTRDLLEALAVAADGTLVDDEGDFDHLFTAGLLRTERDWTDEYQAVLTEKARSAIREVLS